VTDLIAGVSAPVILARVRSSVVAAVVEVLRAHGADRMPVALAGDVLSGTTLGDQLGKALGEGSMVLRPRAIEDGPGAVAFGQAIVADALVRSCAERSKPVARIRELD
jgi:hydrogenase maturation factor HypF (carbamoyltransferase family)